MYTNMDLRIYPCHQEFKFFTNSPTYTGIKNGKECLRGD